jgi:hypothetical protein
MPTNLRAMHQDALDAGVVVIAPECAILVDARLENIVAARHAVEEHCARGSAEIRSLSAMVRCGESTEEGLIVH